MISSITRRSSNSCAVIRSADAAFSRISWLFPSFQRIAAHPSTVITEYTRGYKIGKRLLRPARVKVGRYSEKAGDKSERAGGLIE